jgi:hypothetical protein
MARIGAPPLLIRGMPLAVKFERLRHEMFGEVFALAGAALSLDQSMFAMARDTTGLITPALILALLAGLSLEIGQSVVLFANGVPRQRFILCLLLLSIIFVGGLLIWGASIWLIATYVVQVPIGPTDVVIAVCLGQAPLLFGVLVLIPYLGSSIRRILEAYSLVVVIAALSAMFEIRPLVALSIGGLGWALQMVTLGLLQRPLAGMKRWLWQAASGKPVFVPPRDLSRTLVARLGATDDQRSVEP